METLFAVIFFLSFLAFVVGMFTPKNVGFKSRGKVALVYLGVSFISMILGASFMEDTPEAETVTPQTEQTSYVETETKATENSQQTDVPQPQQAPEQEEDRPQSFQQGCFYMTINSYQYRKTIGDSFMSETADGKYLLVNLSVKNTCNQTQMLDGSDFYVETNDGVRFEYSINASTTLEMSGAKTFSFRECQPGITTTGVLIFEVPKEDTYRLRLSDTY